jgi:hypothetical protein
MQRFAAIVSPTLMLVDVERDSDALSAEILQRFARARDLGGAAGRAWDLRMLFGDGEEALKKKKGAMPQL